MINHMEYNKGEIIMEEIKVNLDNLTNEERETLLKLVEKGNKKNKKRERFKVYCCIDNDGNIVYLNDYYSNNNNDDDDDGTYYNEFHYRFGNYFQTKEEAEFARKKQLVYQKLKDYALEHNTEEIDWDNYNQLKWIIRYEKDYKEIRYSWITDTFYINQIYFTSEKIARDAVKEIGEDNIKKYLFGVNE